jgi:hypothetical protein
MIETAHRDTQSRKERRSVKERRTSTGMIVLSIFAGVLVLCLIFWNIIGDSLREPEEIDALKVGNQTYTAVEFNFYYFGAYQGLLSKSKGSESLMGLDSSKSLADQPCTISDKKMSWKDYFTEQATDTLSRMSAAYSEAVKANYTKTDSVSVTVEDVMEYYKVQSKSDGYSDFAVYLTSTYGKGMTEEVLRGLLEKTYIGKAYADNLKSKYHFTDGELKAYYSKHASEHSTCSYLYAYVGGGASSSPNTCSRLTAVTSRADFESLVLKLTGSKCYTMKDVSGSDLGTATSKDVAWLVDFKRKAGDTYVGQSGETRYVLYFLSSNDNGYSSGKSDGWISIAKTGLTGETFAKWENDTIAKYGVTVCKGMTHAGSLK